MSLDNILLQALCEADDKIVGLTRRVASSPAEISDYLGAMRKEFPLRLAALANTVVDHGISAYRIEDRDTKKTRLKVILAYEHHGKRYIEFHSGRCLQIRASKLKNHAKPAYDVETHKVQPAVVDPQPVKLINGLTPLQCYERFVMRMRLTEGARFEKLANGETRDLLPLDDDQLAMAKKMWSGALNTKVKASDEARRLREYSRTIVDDVEEL